MIRRMFGAPLGGTTRGAHQGVDCVATSLMTPPNGGWPTGIWSPLIVVVALGAPGVPVITCAASGAAASAAANTAAPPTMRLAAEANFILGAPLGIFL